MWCAVKARENTTHTLNEGLQNGPVSGAQVSPTYNAASSANMGVWLFFEVWIINTSASSTPSIPGTFNLRCRLRAYRPQYFVSTIIFGIFINVTGTYGTLFVTMKQAEALGGSLVILHARVLTKSMYSVPFTSNFLYWFRDLSRCQPFAHTIQLARYDLQPHNTRITRIQNSR